MFRIFPYCLAASLVDLRWLDSVELPWIGGHGADVGTSGKYAGADRRVGAVTSGEPAGADRRIGVAAGTSD
jgi:hypothetical protein